MIRTMALCITLVASPAAAQAPCMPRDDLAAQLASKYNEHVIGVGITSGALMEIWSAASGTWTITLSNGSGLACVLAAGDSFETLKTTLGAGDL